MAKITGCVRSLMELRSTDTFKLTKCNREKTLDTSNSNTALSDRWLEDGSYIRFKDITLSYNLPQTALEKIHVKGLRIYVSGLNLYTFSDVSAFDPEAGVTGVVQGIYPYTKSVVGGIELTF